MMKNLKLYSLVLLLAIFVSLPVTFAQRREVKVKVTAAAALLPARGGDTISAAQLRGYLFFIASDEMEGRDTPSRGLDTVAKFIALNLGRWGFKPYGDDGTFFQKIALRRDALDPAKSMAEINGQKFAIGDDFIANPVGGTLTGPLVFAGNGWVVKAKSLDPYQGIDVKDKTIVVVGSGQGGIPKGVTRADLGGTMGEDWSSPGVYAQRHGAKGVLVIPDALAVQNWE